MSSTNKELPEEIRKKLCKEAKVYSIGFGMQDDESAHIAGGIYGYSIAQQEIKGLKEEIEGYQKWIELIKNSTNVTGK